MYKVKLQQKTLLARDGELLSRVLQGHSIPFPHPCGGMGTCGKCTVLVDGKPELSCRYAVHSDISVILPTEQAICAPSGATESGTLNDRMCYALDLGTTTLALALVSLDEKKIIRVVTANNPERAYGADIMSRIAYCTDHDQNDLLTCLVPIIEQMVQSFENPNALPMYVAGNTTMLHLLLGEDCRGIGVAPYRSVFLEKRKTKDLFRGVSEVIFLPGIHAFVGADIVAGMYHIGMPKHGKYRLLLDLGTNAEIVLYSDEHALCTAAAAGPCFEGACIQNGMGALPGAICEAEFKNGILSYKTIDNQEAVGICGTGLVDIIATLVSRGVIDETGALEDESYPISEQVSLYASDVRQFQLAKSAVYSALRALLHIEGIGFSDVDALYVSGGFSSKINVEHAAAVGLLPSELKDKCIAVGNSSLLGTVKYAIEQGDLIPYTKAKYIDLAQDAEFTRLFVENMIFGPDAGALPPRRILGALPRTPQAFKKA